MRDQVDSTIHRPPGLLLNSLRQLRYDVLTSGIAPQSRYRNYVWSILLQTDLSEATQVYCELVARGASPMDAKIRGDSFRTMATDQAFKSKVSEHSLLRALNAYVWLSNNPTSYVQGMNVLCAPFLFVSKSESQAFMLFQTLLTQHCPLYVIPDLRGVHTGVKLVNVVLQLTDPKLYKRLKSKLLTAEIYALASVMTLSACTPPLNELLQLWDLFFAYGVSLNILAVVSQVIGIRNELISSDQPATLLRKLPPLNYTQIKDRMLGILKLVPPELFDLIRRHPFDQQVPKQLEKYLASKALNA